MSETVKVLQIGIGGYGQTYTRLLLENSHNKNYEIVGVVDPRPEGSRYYDELVKRNIPIFENVDDFYSKYSADLAVISSPIQFHRDQTVTALTNGSHVLCEKPMCATVDEALDMINTVKKTGRKLAIGFQWSFNKAILDLKKDIMDGLFGKPLRLKTIVLWARTFEYFGRNQWAGKIRDKNGNYIYDSVANNATAHYLHNMFFVLGDRLDRSTRPLSVTAELYRANDIENFDTCVLNIKAENDVEMLYIASHAVKEHDAPTFCYEFENARVIHGKETENNIVAVFKDGTKKQYGNPQTDIGNKLWLMIDAINEDKVIPCTPEAAFSQTLCINGVQESVPEIAGFPQEIVKKGILAQKNSEGMYVDGLYSILSESYNSWKTPYDMGVTWAKRGKEIVFPDYKDIWD